MTPAEMTDLVGRLERASIGSNGLRRTLCEAAAALQAQAREIEGLRAAMSWLDQALVDEKTPALEFCKRVKFMHVDAAKLAAPAIREGGDE